MRWCSAYVLLSVTESKCTFSVIAWQIIIIYILDNSDGLQITTQQASCIYKSKR